MSLRLEVAPRNYELERLKARQKPRPVQTHPLVNVEGAGGANAPRSGFGAGGANMRIDTTKEKREADDSGSEDDGGIEEKIKAVSCLGFQS